MPNQSWWRRSVLRFNSTRMKPAMLPTSSLCQIRIRLILRVWKAMQEEAQLAEANQRVQCPRRKSSREPRRTHFLRMREIPQTKMKTRTGMREGRMSYPQSMSSLLRRARWKRGFHSLRQLWRSAYLNRKRCRWTWWGRGQCFNTSKTSKRGTFSH